MSGDDAVAVADQLARMESQLRAMTDVLDQRLRYSDQKESMFSQLYRDLEDARRQLSGDQIRPLILDLVLLLDRTEQAAGLHPESPLPSIAQELVEILARQGVERITAPQAALDPTLQQVIGVDGVPATEGVPSGYRVVREGYRFRDRVLRPQQVVAYGS
jgi:molecular chaperone GrpE